MAPDPRFSPSGGPSSGGERTLSSWLGCGCAGLVALFMAVVVLMTFLTWRAGKQLAEMTRDPERAAAEVAEILPYDEMPEGYHPYGTLSVPFLMNVAFLGGPGRPSGEEEGPAFEQAFFYVRVRDWFGSGDRSRGWLESGEGDQSPIDQEEIQFDPEEVVQRGELSSGEARVVWVARRGKVTVDTSRFDGDEEDGGSVVVRMDDEADEHRRETILTMMSVACQDDAGWERMGIWFTPDPAPQAPTDSVDWSGTPADPQALEELLAHFDLCR